MKYVEMTCRLFAWFIGCVCVCVCGQVVSHKDYESREVFESVLHERLMSANVDIVCLAGFMRILTGTLVDVTRHC